MKSRGCYETPGGTLIFCGAPRARSAHARQEHPALQAAAGARLRRAGLQRLLVHAAARGARRLLRNRQRHHHRRSDAGPLQGQREAAFSRKSPYSLYSLDIASFTMGASYDQKDALGFINLIGLPIKVRALAAAQVNEALGRTVRSGPSEVFERFSGSLHFDRRLIDADIRGSQAFARALERVGILTAEERARIVDAFDEIRREAAAPGFFEGATDEDVHTLVIRKLKEKAGAVADKIHTGRSRNEQVSLDVRLWLREECDRVARPARGRHGRAARSRRALSRRRHPRLHPHAPRAGGAVAALPAGVLRDVRARLGALRRSPPPRQRAAARLGRAGRQRLPFRPRGHRARPRLRRHHRQQHGRFRRPRFRRSISSTPPP